MSKANPTHKIARNPAKEIFIPCTVIARRGDWTRVRETGTGRKYWTFELLLPIEG